MTKDSLIEMKIGPQNSNPAKNEVLEKFHLIRK